MAEHKYIGDVCFTTQPTRDGEQKLLMDFGLPDPEVWPGPRPVIILVHGGSWVGWRLQEDLPWRFVDEAGFAVVRFDYRTAYSAPFPAQVADCRSAVRFVRQHAAEYNIDPNCIGVRGVSCGAQLACMLGVGDGAAGIDNSGDDFSVSAAVQAVVDDCGPTDILGLWRLIDRFNRYLASGLISEGRRHLHDEILSDPNAQRHFSRMFIDGACNVVTWLPFIHLVPGMIHRPENLIDIAKQLSGWERGATPILKDEEILRRVSPIEYVTGAYQKQGRRIPPFRILHGEEDNMVPYCQSENFVRDLCKVGVDVEFDSDCGGGGHFPSGEHWWNVIIPKEIAFFKHWLMEGKDEALAQKNLCLNRGG